MEAVRSRTRGSTDNSSGRSAVLCRIIAGENRELLDGVGTQTDAQGASRGTVCIIVYADAVQPRVVLPRSPARDSHLIAKPTLSLTNCLRSGACNSWLKGCKIGGGATIQRKFTHAFPTHN